MPKPRWSSSKSCPSLVDRRLRLVQQYLRSCAKMDHLLSFVGDPHLGAPGNVLDKAAEYPTRGEGADITWAIAKRLRLLHQVLELGQAGGRDRATAGDDLDHDQVSLRLAEENHVWEIGRHLDGEIQFAHQIPILVATFMPGISQVDHTGSFEKE